jgi:hypothetical protein
MEIEAFADELRALKAATDHKGWIAASGHAQVMLEMAKAAEEKLMGRTLEDLCRLLREVPVPVREIALSVVAVEGALAALR